MKFGSIFFIFFLSMGLYAQKKDSTSAPKIIFNYTVWANGNFSIGNVQRILVEAGSKVNVKFGKIVQLATSPYYAYGEQNGNLAERELNTDIHLSLWHEKRVYAIAFADGGVSNLRRIDLRYLGGAGVGLKLIDRPSAYISLTNAILYEHTDYRDRETTQIWRNSTRLFANLKFFKNKMSLTTTAFAQPSLNSSNFRCNSITTIGFTLNKLLKLTTNFRQSYESFVPEGRKHHDLNWTIGIAVGNN